MFRILIAFHLLFAVFAIGPLVHAVTTAARGIRQGDAQATAYSARVARIYALASLLVVIFGFGVMSSKVGGKDVASFGDTYIWLSLLLWAIAMGLTWRIVVPGLQEATRRIGEQQPVAALVPRVAAAGGAVGLIFAAVVFLMVYRPGS